MKKHNNILRLRLAALFLCFVAVFSVAGCSEQGDTLDRVLKEKSIVIGIAPHALPISYEHGDAPAGLAVDLSKELCKRLDVSPEFVFVEREDVVSALEDGRIDLYMFLPSPGQKFNAKVLSVDSGMDYRQVIAVTSASDVKGLYDLKGKTVCTVSHTDASDSLSAAEVFKGDLSQVLYAENTNGLLAMLATGEAAAAVVDEPEFLYATRALADGYYKISSEVLSKSDFLLVMRLRDNALAERIGQIYNDLRSDGTYSDICAKWL